MKKHAAFTCLLFFVLPVIALADLTGLADASASATPLQSTVSPGLPLSLTGASAAVTVNGVTTHPGWYYTIANQLALAEFRRPSLIEAIPVFPV